MHQMSEHLYAYLNNNYRFSLINETKQHTYIRNKFVKFFESNSISLTPEVAFIKATSCNVSLRFVDNDCFLIWDENYWRFINLLFALFNEANDFYKDTDKLSNCMKQICGVYYLVLSTRYSNYPAFSRVLSGISENLGLTPKRIRDLEQASNPCFVNICKEFALSHESYHIVNSAKDRHYYNMASLLYDFGRSNLDNISNQINYAGGFIREGDINRVKDVADNQLKNADSMMMDELIADFHTAMALSSALTQANSLGEESTVGLYYNTCTRFLTFNTLLGLLNSWWSWVLPIIRAAKVPNRNKKPIITLDSENAFSMVRNWMFQITMDFCIKKERIRTCAEEEYRSYVQYRRKREQKNDILVDALYATWSKYVMLSTEKMYDLIDISALIQQNNVSFINSCQLTYSLFASV